MRRFFGWVGVFLIVCVTVILFWAAFRNRRPELPVRAIWVSRYEYKTPADVEKIVKNLAGAGFTDLFFQVRGNGTAYYKSSYEPWAFELSGSGDNVALLGKDPGWDPLQLAIDTARGTQLRIHAYMNVLPGWKGLADPPPEQGQLWSAHPDWFMVDSFGSKMLPTPGWYAFINPVMPEVRAHLKAVARELSEYDVAGVHLDYIRYPHDYRDEAPKRYPNASKAEIEQRSEFSYDPASINALADRFGAFPSKEQIREFRCDSVTQVVREISDGLQKDRLLSCSVLGNLIDGKYLAYQDSGKWAKEGLVDWVVQMNYATRSFNLYLEKMEEATGNRAFRDRVIVGLFCKNDTDLLLEQIDTAKASGCRGLALFSYGYLFNDHHQLTEKGRRVLERFIPAE
ncbi:MAG: family 10 glycosylhydrolase [Pontiellaceae bacterium]|nr:family 10 glycosylhydrolase [Pontiellaceae bacterium]